jgi:histidine triad (HIT) family protein
MRLTSLGNERKVERLALARRVEELKAQGICPTCQDLQHGDIYPPGADRVFYEDDAVCCLLELWPRNPGHTIILLKPHFEDISQMPLAFGARVLPVLHATIGALKEVLGAEKVYLCTMCDGRRNHLHLQLIPRLPGDAITGSQLFVKDRAYLEDYADTVRHLARRLLPEANDGMPISP